MEPHPKLQQQAPWLEGGFLRVNDPKLWGPRPDLDWYSLDDPEVGVIESVRP